MTAFLGGLGAACCWAVTTLTSARASRVAGAGPTLAWVMLTGLLITLPFVAVAGAPPSSAIGWLVVAGVGNTVGLLLEYTAVRGGKVGIVAAIASTEGAITAVIASILGEPLSAATALTLALIATGVVLAALGPDRTPDAGGRSGPRAVLLAIGAAVSFGIGLYAAAHVSGDVPLAWVALPARLVGVIVVALPLALRRRIRIERPVIPLVVAAGAAEVAGIMSFALGARENIGVASVLGSQFAALAAVGAFVFFGERLRRVQFAGVVAIVVGVGSLAALRAGA